MVCELEWVELEILLILQKGVMINTSLNLMLFIKTASKRAK
jgi:hypothetical protein